MEEVSEQALIALRNALDGAEELFFNGNSTDEYNALQFLAKKAKALLEEVGY